VIGGVGDRDGVAELLDDLVALGAVDDAFRLEEDVTRDHREAARVAAHRLVLLERQ
jgi:hypothetical protein